VENLVGYAARICDEGLRRGLALEGGGMDVGCFLFVRYMLREGVSAYLKHWPILVRSH